MSTANYNALAGSLLTRGKLQPDGTAIGAGATLGTDVACEGDSTLVVEVDMTGGAAGDLTVVVVPYEADNVTLMTGIVLPVVQANGPVLNAGAVRYYAQFDVTGVERARVNLTNNNVAGQTLTRSSWRLA